MQRPAPRHTATHERTTCSQAPLCLARSRSGSQRQQQQSWHPLLLTSPRQPQKAAAAPRLAMELRSHALPDLPSDMELLEADEWVGSVAVRSGRSGIPAAAAAPLKKQQQSRGPPPAPQQPLSWTTKLADRATAAVSLEARYELPPHLLFDLLADPRHHADIFDEILAADSELLEVDGPRKFYRLDYTAAWRFWRVSGVCLNRLWMWTDAEAGTVRFQLREPGFLRRYEGVWTITAGCGAPLSAFATPVRAAAAQAFDLRASSRSSSSGSLPGSPGARSSASSSSGSGGFSWADAAATIDIFTGRGGASDGGVTLRGSGSAGGKQPVLSGISSSGSTSSSSPSRWPLMHFAPLASVTAAAASSTVGLQALGASLYSSLAYLAGWFSTSTGQPAHAPWTPLDAASLKPTGMGARTAAGAAASNDGSGAPTAALLPMPTTALITASTLTSPKLTPPYPLNQLLKTQSKGQVQDMLDGLVTAARLQASPLQGL